MKLPELKKENKIVTSIRFDVDVLDWLNSKDNWRPRLNQLLREMMEAENAKEV